MPLVPREKIDDVRERTNIVEIVKRHVELKRAGTGSWKGLCPFHSEKTPSFTVHEPRQFFHCFGCGEKGDVISFLVRVEQRPFMDVLTDLAGLAGVDLDVRPLTPAERRTKDAEKSERQRMFEVLELAASYFEQQYLSPAGAAARTYVEGRGIGQAVRERFRVGYAPARWDGLSSFLADHKIPQSVLVDLGLVGVNERGRYDFFRDRVMLPVIDRQKRVIGFGGRLLDPEAKDRKYVNSPESPLFHKKESLYGLHAALDAIRRSGTAIVVEGNFDVLTLHEAGIEEAVAPMGTALTAEQVATLGRMSKNIVLVFDPDPAGKRAAPKSVLEIIPLDSGTASHGAHSETIASSRVARLPPGMDPDDFVRSSGADAFRRLVENSRPIIDHYIHEVDSRYGSSVPQKLQALDEIASMLVRLKNPTARELWSGQVAGVLGLTPQQVRRALQEAAALATRGAPSAAAPLAPESPVAAPATPLPPEELHLVVLLARCPELLRTPEAARAGDLLLHPILRRLHRAAAAAVAETGGLEISSWLDAAPTEQRSKVAAALMDGSLAAVSDPPGLLRKLAARLELLRVEAEIAMGARLQREAHARGDDATLRALSVRGMELRKTKEGLQAALQRP